VGRALLVFCVLLSFLETVLWAALAPVIPTLARDPGLSAAQVGTLTAAYSAGIVIAAVPVGYAASRLGPRVIALAGLWALSIGSLAFAFSQSSLELDLSRFVQGTGAAAAWAGALAWVAATFSGPERGGAIGLTLSASFCGVLLGPLIGAVAASAGRQPTFTVIGVGLGLAALWGGPSDLKTQRPGRKRASLGAFRQPILLVPLVSLVSFGVLTGAVSALGPLLLTERGLGAGAIAACFVCAAVPQVLFTSALGRRLGRSGLVHFCIAILLLTAVLLPLVTLPNGGLATAVLFSGVVVLEFLAFNPALLLMSVLAERVGASQEFSMSLANGTWGFGSAVGSVCLARVADAASISVAFLVTGALAATTGMILAAALRAGVIPRSLRVQAGDASA
jgi:predicted MFS family arabinose efflux permease